MADLMSDEYHNSELAPKPGYFFYVLGPETRLYALLHGSKPKIYQLLIPARTLVVRSGSEIIKPNHAAD